MSWMPLLKLVQEPVQRVPVLQRPERSELSHDLQPQSWRRSRAAVFLPQLPESSRRPAPWPASS